jgi:hypothetical protein
VRNITLSAEPDLIDDARAQAQRENSTLNEQFRLWLVRYTQRRSRAEAAMASIKALQQYVDTSGRKFTREEMNER